MAAQKKLKEALKKEILRSLLISDEDKAYWLGNIDDLPDVLVDEMTRVVLKKNTVVDGYLDTALGNDPDHKYLAELKNKLAKAKKKAFSIDEKTEKGRAEKYLENKLKKI
jgi:hypothetical protein